MDSYSTIKGLQFIFNFRKKFLDKKKFDSPGYDTPKNRITQRMLNQNRNFFNPLLGGPGRLEL